MKFLVEFFDVKIEQDVSYHAEARQTTHESARQTTSNTQKATQQPNRASTRAAKPPAAPVRPALVKEPDDLGTPDLPRPDEVTWLSDSRKTRIAIDTLNGAKWGMSYDWNKYYLERKPVEEIVDEQDQKSYDSFWRTLRACWKMLNHPFWSAYIAGHFPNPQAVSGHPELIKEICVLDVKELKRRQADSLIKDGVYTLGLLQRSLFNDQWRPAGLTDRDKWYFRKVVTQYGLEAPPSNEPDPIPFAELYIGAVFGVKVTSKKRLNSYGFILGDEPLEDRIARAKELSGVIEWYIDDCEDIMFYQYSTMHDEHTLKWAMRNVRGNLKARKILAGGDYPEMRSSAAEGVNLDELEKVLAKDLELSPRAKRMIHEDFCSDDVTLADLVRNYADWLLNDDTSAATELKEYLYQHNYVIRPEDMPMDARTPVAYLRLPTRIRYYLRYGRVETVDDLVRWCSGNGPVFNLRDLKGIGKRAMETIQDRLTELGFLADS